MARPAGAPLTRRERRAAERLDRPTRARARRAKERPAWRSPMVLVTAAALVVGAAIIGFALPKAPATDDELRTPPIAYPAEVIFGQNLGPEGAPVVMQLYSDFQCPACRLFVTEQLHRLVAEFVAPGTLRIEARDIAFLGRGSRDESLELAAGARCAAEQGRYWEFHDLVFWNQGRENRGDHSAAFLDRMATASALDPTGFHACLDRSEIRAGISNQTQAAITAGIASTPTLIVNGRSVVGVPQYDQLAALIRDLAAGGSPAPAPSPTPGS